MSRSDSNKNGPSGAESKRKSELNSGTLKDMEAEKCMISFNDLLAEIDAPVEM